MRRTTVGFLCCLASLAAFAAGPLSDSERPLAPAPIIADGLKEQLIADYLTAAGSPYGFLLAWHEKGILLAARLSPDGEVIDRDPIVIGSMSSGAPYIEWNGSDYVVGWRSRPFYPDPALSRTWYVAPDGIVRGPFDRPVQRNGRGELLTVETEAFGRWATFVAVGENGARRSLATVNTVNTLIPYMIVPVGDGWGVLATEIGRVRWFTINPDGTYYTTVFGSSVGFQSIVHHENEIAYSWTNFVGREAEVGYNVVDIRTGGYRTEVLRPSSPGMDFSSGPVLSYSGNDLIVAWAEGEPKVAGRNTVYVKSGGVTRTVATYDSVDWVKPVLATGARNLIAWTVSNFPSVFSQTFARTFVDAGELEDGRAPKTLREGPATQLFPRAAASSNGFFAAWTEYAPTPRVFGRFYPAAGAPSAPVAVSAPGQLASYDVAVGNGTYLVAWSESDYGIIPTRGLDITEVRILMRRYDATGAALDAAPVTIVTINASPVATGVAVINDGATFVIAWKGDGGTLHATRVRSTGPGMISPVLRLLEDSLVAGPKLVRVGGGIVALYEVEPHFAKRIEVARIRPDLSVESRETLWEIKRLQTNGVGQYYDGNAFAAAGNGDELLLAWSEKAEQPSNGNHWPSNGNHCLYSRRYTSSFVPIEPAREIACHEPYRDEIDYKRYAAGGCVGRQAVVDHRVGRCRGRGDECMASRRRRLSRTAGDDGCARTSGPERCAHSGAVRIDRALLAAVRRARAVQRHQERLREGRLLLAHRDERAPPLRGPLNHLL